ncbi:spore photoproduct lyase [Clostridium oceanicum]|uniref:Spore photoproduct lyase n=1 Tax=Clostridium oceanicum TaxID=1543 RepID=A0ABP3UY11_9CLOT
MFNPKRVVFEEAALDYEKGKILLSKFKDKNLDIRYSKSGRVTGIPGKTPSDMYLEGKNTLVVGVRKSLKFQTCKPSAHYQLPLVSGCMGMCEYCYLNTQMGKKPYIKIYANTLEILNKAEEYAKERLPETTIFEGAATSDPIPVEPYSNSLKDTIEYFGKKDNMKFRFVTKFTNIDNLLNLNHNNKTTIRFSINTEKIIQEFEHRTPQIMDRLNAAYKVADAGYKVGFIIAPVFIYDNWKNEYTDLLLTIKNLFRNKEIKFEVISHRFTKRAKQNILDIFPSTLLPMEEEERKFKYGQFGYGKYIYKDQDLNDMKDFFKNNIIKYFGEESINYII